DPRPVGPAAQSGRDPARFLAGWHQGAGRPLPPGSRTGLGRTQRPAGDYEVRTGTLFPTDSSVRARSQARTDESVGNNQRAGIFDGSPAAGGYNQGRGTAFTLRNGRMAMPRLLPLAAALGVLASLAPAAPPEKFTFVDLKPYTNQKLTDNFGSGR